MPYEWDDLTQGAPVQTGAFSYADNDSPALRLTLWPHRSLSHKGFAVFIGVTFAMLLIPLTAMLGTLIWWALLPHLLGALALTWYLIRRNYKDGELREDLTLWSDRLDLVRTNPRRATQTWTANPHWVKLTLHTNEGPVEHYLTLKGDGREVELGAFLSPDERKSLHGELLTALRRLSIAHDRP